MKQQIYQIHRSSGNWPERMQHLCGMPDSLQVIGHLPENDKKTVAIVGARQCSQGGKKLAYQFANALAKAGVAIISGMAKGIDGSAHQGALDAGGRTYAVLGCGVDVCYPEVNRILYEKIPINGGIISELPQGTKPFAWNFPRRNRIISALSDVVLVVEAKEKSGSLITADFALEQGRDVYAVPGRITDTLSAGCNRLISMGAGVALTPSQMLSELGICTDSIVPGRKNQEKRLESEINMVYSCVDLQPKSLYTILQEVPLPEEKVLRLLLQLQLEGSVEEVFRGCYVRT